MELKLAELQKSVLEKAARVLEPQGYKFKKNDLSRFEKRDEYFSSCVQFYFKTKSSFVGFSKYLLTFHNVESIIMEIGIPTNDFETQKKGLVLLSTLEDKNSVLEFDEKNGVRSEEDWVSWGNAIELYLKTDGKVFLEQYQQLPAVLEKIDQLQMEGKYWHEILAGGPEYFFRGLIISKLCNDKNYQDKINYGDNVFIPNVSDSWKPYYAKLKVKLETI